MKIVENSRKSSKWQYEISGYSTYQAMSDSDSDKNKMENTYLELCANSRLFGGRHSLTRLSQSLKKQDRTIPCRTVVRAAKMSNKLQRWKQTSPIARFNFLMIFTTEAEKFHTFHTNDVALQSYQKPLIGRNLGAKMVAR